MLIVGKLLLADALLSSVLLIVLAALLHSRQVRKV